MDTPRNILQFLHYHPNVSRQKIAECIGFQGSDATLKRLIAKEVNAGNDKQLLLSAKNEK